MQKKFKITAKTIFLIILLMICSITVIMVSCSDANGNNSRSADSENGHNAAGEDTETIGESNKNKLAYEYPIADFHGYTLRILNVTNLWDMYTYLDKTEINGEVLNDAVYNRNRDIEQRYNFILNEITIEKDVDGVKNAAVKSLMAGDNDYDIVYLSLVHVPALMLEGYFCNLLNIPELRLDKPWWDQQIVSSVKLGNSLFFATSPWHLMTFEGTWCLFFNETMMENYNMQKPYAAVSEGAWTIDKLHEYCLGAASLNGDADFTWHPAGSAVYGIATHPNVVQKFIIGTGEKFADLNKDGYPVFTADNERFYNIITNLSKLLKSGDGAHFKADAEDFSIPKGGYMHVFTTERSMFLSGEIKAAQLMRNMDSTFGITPFPKFGEAQESYYSGTVYQLFVFLIPVTNPDPSIAGTIADVMSYQSYVDVLPVYFDIVVSQKGLRNEESIQMLNIIRDTRRIDIGEVFGWTSSLASSIAEKVFAGNDSVASDIAAARPKTDESIKIMMEKFAELN